MNDENPKSQSYSQSLGLVQEIQPPEVEQPNVENTSPGKPATRILKKPLWPVITLAMLVLAGFTGWKIYHGLQQPSSSETIETSPTRLPVRVTRAQKGLAQAWVFDEGISLPVQLRVLNFYADGDITYVAKNNGVALKEGDFVSRGQLLATVDDRRQTSSMVTSEADIQVAINERDQSQASVLQAKAELAKAESDLALAQTEYQRYHHYSNKELYQPAHGMSTAIASIRLKRLSKLLNKQSRLLKIMCVWPILLFNRPKPVVLAQQWIWKILSWSLPLTG